MGRILALGLIAAFASTLPAQTINVHGKVVSAAGQAVNMAVVELVRLGRKDTTGADGMYALSGATALQRAPLAGGMSLKNGILQLLVARPASLTVEVFDLKGNQLRMESVPNAEEGVYRWDFAEKPLSDQIMIIKASIGKEARTFRYQPMRDGSAGGRPAAGFTASAAYLAKTAAVVDTLKVTATGYATFKLPIGSLDTTADVTLTPSSSGGEVRSEGCGKTPPAQSNARQTIDVAGTARQYIVNYPTPYDPNRAYRVLYIHHGRGGNAEQNITRNGGWYGVGPLSGGSVIFVSPHGDGDGSTTGWPNTGGRDVAFLRTLVTHINETFCVDKSRIFTTGMSYGGNFSNTLGCEMGDVFRAIAPFSGWGPNGGPSGGGGGNAKCVGKPAAIVTHGTADDMIDFSSGEASRDHWLQANHCTTTTTPIEPSPCVLYQGCDAGYPVAFCQHTGGHILPTFSGPAIWNFISQF
jgi:polyhydroxybutyrate depolymerase